VVSPNFFFLQVLFERGHTCFTLIIKVILIKPPPYLNLFHDCHSFLIIMAVDLHTSSGSGDSSLPYDSLLPPSTDLTHSNKFIINGSDSNQEILISRDFGSHTYTTPPPHSIEAQQSQGNEDDLFDELLTQHMHMVNSMLQQDHTLNPSDIRSDNCKLVLICFLLCFFFLLDSRN